MPPPTNGASQYRHGGGSVPIAGLAAGSGRDDVTIARLERPTAAVCRHRVVSTGGGPVREHDGPRANTGDTKVKRV
jgi:hypothetical protein